MNHEFKVNHTYATATPSEILKTTTNLDVTEFLGGRSAAESETVGRQGEFLNTSSETDRILTYDNFGRQSVKVETTPPKKRECGCSALDGRNHYNPKF